MDVATITAPVAEAKAKLAEYRAALKRRFDKSDEVLAKTYRELAKGNMIINVRDAIINAGLDDQHRPKMAIAKADAEHVWFQRSVGTARRGTWVQVDSFFTDNSNRKVSNSYELPRGSFADCPEDCKRVTHTRVRAMVPLIAPQFRPPHSLSNYHILWDAEGTWEAQPPVDPFLIKRISGDLFVVLAVWDLTELERAVLKGIRAGAN